MTPEHRAAIDRIATTPGTCPRCATERVCCVLGAWDGPPEPLPPPRFGCPRCEVRLVWQVDACGIWTAALRDPVDPHWQWATEDVRGPIARAGLLLASGSPYALAAAFHGHVWVGDRTCLVATPEPADAIDKAWQRLDMAGPDWWRQRYAAPAEAALLAWFRSTDYLPAGDAIDCGDHAIVETAWPTVTAALSTALVELVTTLHPGARWWVRAAEEPVLARVHGRPVAVVMPMRQRGEATAAVEQAA